MLSRRTNALLFGIWDELWKKKKIKNFQVADEPKKRKKRKKKEKKKKWKNASKVTNHMIRVQWPVLSGKGGAEREKGKRNSAVRSVRPYRHKASLCLFTYLFMYLFYPRAETNLRGGRLSAKASLWTLTTRVSLLAIAASSWDMLWCTFCLLLLSIDLDKLSFLFICYFVVVIVVRFVIVFITSFHTVHQ